MMDLQLLVDRVLASPVMCDSAWVDSDLYAHPCGREAVILVDGSAYCAKHAEQARDENSVVEAL